MGCSNHFLDRNPWKSIAGRGRLERRRLGREFRRPDLSLERIGIVGELGSHTRIQIPPNPLGGTADQIAVGADGDTWAIDSEQHLYDYDAQYQTFYPVEPGVSYTSVSVGFDGAVWVLHPDGTVAKLGPIYGSFAPPPQSLTQVSVGADGDAWGVDGTLVYHYNRLTLNWDPISGSFTRISVGSGANVWGLDLSGAIYRFDSPSQSWMNVPGTLAQISVGQNGAVWGLDRIGNIFHYVQPIQPTGTFHLVPGTLAQIAVAADGNVWGLNAAGQIFTFDPLTQNWTLVPGELAQIVLDQGGRVWGINSEKPDLSLQCFYSKLGVDSRGTEANRAG